MRRGNFLIYAAFLIGSFLILKSLVIAANNDIIINEVGAYPTSTHEWIEIWNKGADPVDMRSWKLWENNTNHSIAVGECKGVACQAPTTTILNGGSYGVITQDSNQFWLDYPQFEGFVFDSSWSSLSESGEEIGLKDSDGNIIEQFVYVPANNYSLERRDPYVSDYTTTNWQENNSGNTVGKQNSNYYHVLETSDITTSTLSTTDMPTTTMNDTTSTDSTSENIILSPTPEPLWQYLKINELVSNPDNGPEWIELYNTTSTDINLTGTTLCDNRAANCTITSPTSTVPALEWTVIYLDGSHLNNGGDSVILKDPEGKILDMITYGNSLSVPDSGQALARTLDGQENGWSITTDPTPGSANHIALPPLKQNTNNPTSYELPATSLNQKTTSTTTTKTMTKAAPKEAAVHLAWDIKTRAVAAPNEPTTFDAAGLADPRGGTIAMHWDFGDSTYADGIRVAHTYTSTGTMHIIIHATSTQNTVDTKEITLLVLPGLSANEAGVWINEIFSNPTGTDNAEFIELYNASSSTVDISGWRLVDSGEKYFTIPAHTTLLSQNYLVFYRRATKISIDNNRDTISLETPTEAVVDRVAITKSVENASYNRTDSGWSWSTSTTPGSQNIVPHITDVLGEKISAPPKKRSIKKVSSTSVGVVTPATARTISKGSPVNVRGTVTVLPAQFGSQYFYITDQTGGIQIYQAKKNFPTIKLGDTVSVVGTLSSAYGVPRINVKQASDIRVIGHQTTTTPRTITTGDVGEDTLGLLVSLEGEITEMKSNYFYLDDGEHEVQVYLKVGAHIDKKKLREGNKVSVTGILEKNSNNTQLLPRSNADITVSSLQTEKSQKYLDDDRNKKTSEVKKYTIALLIGVLVTLVIWSIKTRRWSKVHQKIVDRFLKGTF